MLDTSLDVVQGELFPDKCDYCGTACISQHTTKKFVNGNEVTFFFCSELHSQYFYLDHLRRSQQ